MSKYTQAQLDALDRRANGPGIPGLWIFLLGIPIALGGIALDAVPLMFVGIGVLGLGLILLLVAAAISAPASAARGAEEVRAWKDIVAQGVQEFREETNPALAASTEYKRVMAAQGFAVSDEEATREAYSALAEADEAEDHDDFDDDYDDLDAEDYEEPAPAPAPVQQPQATPAAPTGPPGLNNQPSQPGSDVWS